MVKQDNTVIANDIAGFIEKGVNAQGQRSDLDIRISKELIVATKG